MQIGRVIKLAAYLFVILCINTSLKAEVVKFANCKFTQDSLSKTIHEVLNERKKEMGEKTTPYNVKKAMEKKNSIHFLRIGRLNHMRLNMLEKNFLSQSKNGKKFKCLKLTVIAIS